MTTESQYGPTACSPASCANGKCQATGECACPEWPKTDREWARLAVVEASPLAPNATTIAAIEELERGGGEVADRGDGLPVYRVGKYFADYSPVSAAELAPIPEVEELFTNSVSVNRHVASPPLTPQGGGLIGYQGDLPDTFRTAPVAAPRLIIAFTGLAGAGKSTAAMHLVKHRGFQRVRFAGPLKSMMAALGLTAAEIDGALKETPCELLGGKTPRWAMQSLGTEWGRDLIASDLWIRAWSAALAKVPAGVPVVVDDCRFPNEAVAVTAAGGQLVRIVRPGAGAGTSSVHASEQHQLPARRTLHNTMSERNLREQVDILLGDLSWMERHAAS